MPDDQITHHVAFERMDGVVRSERPSYDHASLEEMVTGEKWDSSTEGHPLVLHPDGRLMTLDQFNVERQATDPRVVGGVSDTIGEIKYLSLTEFRELGVLQEVNRTCLHPMGLALEIIVAGDERTVTSISGVWDYRDDETGMSYGDAAAHKRVRAEIVAMAVEALTGGAL